MKESKVFMYVLGALIVIGFFASIIVFAKIGVPEQNKDLLNIILGSLIAAFATVVGYFYGSSKGSADKNEMLGK